MKFLAGLERKYGRYAISNLTLYIIATYGIGYLISSLAPNVLAYLILEPALILQGQVWRLVTWLLIPPGSVNIFTVIMLFFYYSLGTALERTWGAFRYNVYIFGGILLTIGGAFLLFFIMGGDKGSLLYQQGGFFSTYYIAMSIFLGFAAEYPNMQVLLYFILPIKIKWLAMVDIVFLAYEMVQSNWVVRAMIFCSLLNFIIFFFLGRKRKGFRSEFFGKTSHGKKTGSFGDFRRTFTGSSGSQGPEKIRPAGAAAKPITRHKCAICGRTELDGDDLEFRFCSKCEGNYEYCQDHLFTHTHVGVKKDDF